MIERIIIAVLTSLASKLYDRLIKKAIDPEDAEIKLRQIKATAKEAFDGSALTPEQKDELKNSLRSALKVTRG